MKIVITDRDTVTALLVARATINDILARRSDHSDASYQQKIVTGTPQPMQQSLPLGPALSDPTEMANQPAPLAEPSLAVPPPPAAPAEPEKRSRGRPRKEAPPVAKTYTLDEIRKRMVDLSTRGNAMMDAQRALIHSMQISKISELPVDRYAEFMDKLSALEARHGAEQ